MAIAIKLDNRFDMFIHPRLEKVSKRTVGLVCLVSGLLGRCAKFAPDGPVNANGGTTAGTAGTTDSQSGSESGAGAGVGSGGKAGSFGDAGRVGGEESAGEAGTAADAGSAGAAPEFMPIKPERSVIETNPDALTYFTLERVLGRATSEPGDDVFRALVRSFGESEPGGGLPGPHCDDESPSVNGLSSLNGFMLPCPAEAVSFYGIPLWTWRPLAVTNRFDLAPLGGENCGEQHLSFFYDSSFVAQSQITGAYLNFVAVIANPRPELGLEGCRPLLDFWASLGQSEYDTPDRRARALESAFLGSSLPPTSAATSRELSALTNAGFLPLVSPQYFGRAGRLQLLYLGFWGDWHFFEHALVSSKEGLVLRRPLTQTLPVHELLDQHAKREQCIDGLISSIPTLLNENVNLLRLNIDPVCFAATNSTEEPTLAAGLVSTPLGPELRSRLDDYMRHSFPDSGLLGIDIARRAGFAGTCSGCHALEESPLWNANGVSHVSYDPMQSCATSGPDSTRSCYARSPLLNTIFIPHWTRVLNDFLRRVGAYGPIPGGAPSSSAIDGAPLARRLP
jgi:hypothetical protein